YDSSQGFVHLIGRRKRLPVSNRGVNASTVVPSQNVWPNPYEAGDVRLADVTSITPAPAQVVVLYGTNDMAQIGGPESVADFQAAYLDMMQKLASALPNTRFRCLGILPRKDIGAADRAPWSAAIQAVVTSLNSPRVRFIPTEGW